MSREYIHKAQPETAKWETRRKIAAPLCAELSPD